MTAQNKSYKTDEHIGRMAKLLKAFIKYKDVDDDDNYIDDCDTNIV